MKSNNLFSFAASEMTGSAFWAWVLGSLCENPQTKGDEEVRQLAKGFLRKAGIKSASDNIGSVKTEVPCEWTPTNKGEKHKGRADIVLYGKEKNGGNEEIIAIIENKLFSTPRVENVAKQVSNYAEKTLNAKKIVMTWRHDTKLEWERWKKQECNKPDSTIDISDIAFMPLDVQVDLLKPSHSHPILQQYHQYAASILEGRNDDLKKITNETNLFEFNEMGSGRLQNDKETVLLNWGDTQWKLMQQITEGFCGKDGEGVVIYNGTNNDGAPWTQARFLSVEYGKYKHEFFYRIDKGTKGFYFRLNYYTTLISEDKKLKAKDHVPEHKEDIIKSGKLAKQLKIAFDESPWFDKLPYKSISEKRRESTLWCIWFNDLPKDVTVENLHKWLEEWHKAFCGNINEDTFKC